MGVIKQGILGGFSGRVGPVVGSTWKGISVMKTRPVSVTNPDTVAQQAQRGSMTQIVIAARQILGSIIQPFWNPFAQGMSGYNMFVSTNIKAFNKDEFINPANFYSQRGSLLGVKGMGAAASAAGNSIDVTWEDNTGESDALGTDEAVILYYNRTTKKWYSDVAGATRANATVSVGDIVMSQGDILDVFLGFSRPNVSKVSDSSYVSITVGA